MSEQSTVVGALERIGNILGAFSGSAQTDFPNLAIGPVEHVLVFNSNDRITLTTTSKTKGYFHSTGQGVTTDLWGRIVAGAHVESSLPVDLTELGESTLWPPPQPLPFNKPPVDNTNTTQIGYAKNKITFSDGSIGTVGPSLAKILRLKGGKGDYGPAQFWETSVLAICQGTGKYEGARGMLVFAGSAYFEEWPWGVKDPVKQGELIIKLLSAGFDAKLVRCFKLVLEPDIA